MATKSKSEEGEMKVDRKVKLQAGDIVEGSPFPVKVDEKGNRKVIPKEMVDFQFAKGAGNKFVKGETRSMHTIAAEKLSFRKKGTILGKTEKEPFVQKGSA